MSKQRKQRYLRHIEIDLKSPAVASSLKVGGLEFPVRYLKLELVPGDQLLHAEIHAYLRPEKGNAKSDREHGDFNRAKIQKITGGILIDESVPLDAGFPEETVEEAMGGSPADPAEAEEIDLERANRAAEKLRREED